MFCDICYERLAASEDGYKIHLRRFHPLESNSKPLPRHFSKGSYEPIKPARTTNRTKAQIVHDMEKTWGAALIPEVKPWHSLEDK